MLGAKIKKQIHVTFSLPSRDTPSIRKTGTAAIQYKYMLGLGRHSGNTGRER